MFFLGVGTTIVGAASRNIGLSPFQIGLLLAVQNVGFMFSVLAVGALSDRFDKAKILFFGSLVLSVSFALFYRWQPFAANCLIMFFLGIGIGSYEGATDAMLLDLHRRRQSLHISINHLFVTLGALTITLYLIFLQMNWGRSTTQSAAVVLFIAVLYGFSRTGISRAAAGPLAERLGTLRRQPVIAVLFLSAMCAIGLELGSAGILTTFLMDFRGFGQVSSKVGLIVFISGVAVGRLVLGFASRSGRTLAIMLWLYGAASVFLSVLYFVPVPDAGVYALLFLSGTAVSSLLPLTIALGGALFSGSAGTALGFIKLAIPVGGILVPLLLSLVSRFVSFRASLALFPAVGLAGFAALAAGRRRMNRSEGGDRTAPFTGA